MSKLMKKLTMTVMALTCAITMFAAGKLQAQAADATVHGTVRSGTTENMLYLSTDQGNMEIKIDSNTDTSDCKVLLPNKSITVSVTGNSDGYLHATKITSKEAVSNVTVDTSNTTTVSGTVASGTTENLLYLSTSAGTMQIKMDSGTDLSDCKVLILGQTVQVKIGRGSDAYQHAISISEAAGGSGKGGAISNINGINVTAVSGTVQNNTTASLMYLSTGGQTMQIVLDLATDIDECKALYSGQSVTAYVYRGNDAYMHAAKLVDNASYQESGASVSGNNVTVSGKVTSGTTAHVLYLETSGGVMQIKLDDNTNMKSVGVLMQGRTISVTCASGSDSWMHAVSIAGR